MSLKTIQEHNDEVYHRLGNYNTSVECPNCGKELQFVDNTVMLSNPPQRDVKCFECGYTNRIKV